LALSIAGVEARPAVAVLAGTTARVYGLSIA
jgi:hypothetical protein